MYPIQKQEGHRGIGMGYSQFSDEFKSICQDHLEDRRAKFFAFMFYDMRNGIVRRALKEAHGFRLLHEKTGNDITLFYLHDHAVDDHACSFNNDFMAALGIQDQANPPCIVFFRVQDEHICDVSIYKIDEQAQDPVLVIAELEQYVDDAITKMKAEGDFSALTDLGKLVAPVTALFRLGKVFF